MTYNYSPAQFLIIRFLSGLLIVAYPVARFTGLGSSPMIALDLFLMLLGYLLLIGYRSQLVSHCLLVSLGLHIFICSPSPIHFLFSSSCIFLATIFTLVDQSELNLIPDTGERKWNLGEGPWRLAVFFQSLALFLLGLFFLWEWQSISVGYSPLENLVDKHGELYSSIFPLALFIFFLATTLASIHAPYRKVCWSIQMVALIGLLVFHCFSIPFIPFLLLQALAFDARWLQPSSDYSGIIYFDGHCILCSGWVNFVMREDSFGRLKFATLQGETAKEKLPKDYIENLDSIALQASSSDKIYRRSSAVLRIMASLGGFWTLSKLLLLIPRFIRDGVYALIAGIRYKVFGKTEICRIPMPEEKEKMLP